MIKAYCDACGEMKNAHFDEILKDDLNEFPWGDLVCECSMVIATLGAEKAGKIVFVPHSGGDLK